MRQVKEFDTADGKRYRVRYRLGGRETSETFRRRQDAQTFATILDGGGVPDALAWIKAREPQHTAPDFAAYLEHYLAQLTGITSRTRADYRAQYRRYLTSLGPLPLSLITKAHVAGVVNDMDAAGLSPKTIKNAVHMLSSVLALAVEEGIISRNPCRRVRLPRRSIDSDAEPRFLTYAEAGALVAATPAHYRPLVVFLLGTGLRWSEATAIQSRHVNLTNGTVQVRQSWKRIPGGFELGPPKTEKSRRTVNAAAQALAAIAPLLGKPQEFVFTTPAGRTVSHSNFYARIWKPACVAAGLDPRPRIHDTRHTHASWLIAEGKSLEQVQDQMGHESILTTRSVYGALMPALGIETGQAASAAMARMLTGRELTP